jgi:hypothetical protein
MRYAHVPVKQAVISPSALSLMYPAESIRDYSREQFIDDLLSEDETEIRRCLKKGAHKVQVDFTEGRLAVKIDPSGHLLNSFIDLNNLALSRLRANGGTRPLGIPTVADRIAQEVARRYLEPHLEPVFHADSYGYRPGRSAIDAVRQARQRCWRYDWVLDIDVKGHFDSIDWELLLKAVRRHTDCAWVLLYIERWLKAPVQMEDGSVLPRTAGTPQGGVISPLLANMFLHYAFDAWMSRNYPHLPFGRYADDAICHCKSAEGARALWSALQERFAACKLVLHPEKTKIVNCKDANRRGNFRAGSLPASGPEPLRSDPEASAARPSSASCDRRPSAWPPRCRCRASAAPSLLPC